MSWNKFRLGQEYMVNTILLYIVFTFVIVSTFIITGGIINAVNISDKFEGWFYFIAGMIPIILIRYILDIECDPEVE